ncbi:MAG: TatD family hydrolase [Candidatus Pacebacteria bacterium]|nr:TatD family hydrolase [Candidatus Paceibacterota bacterium]
MHIDIHTHVNLSAFKDDFDVVIRHTLDNDVWMVNVGTQIDTSKRAVELLDLYPEGVYATVGLHPIHTSPSFHDEDEVGQDGKPFTSRGEVFDHDAYKVLALHPKVVAIGECGLDYYHLLDEDSRKKQVEGFEAQIALANEIGKPLMLHLRSGKGGNAYKDAYEILKRQAKVLGNSHFFAGSLEDAKLFWDMGYSTSFTGVITFTRDYDEVVRSAPAHLIHAETDAPYVAPKPYRGQRNEPLHVREVVARMAELRGVGAEEWQERLWGNAQTVFPLV